MNKQFYILSFILSLLSFSTLNGQTKFDTTNLVGLWTYCTTSKLDTSFNCKHGWAKFKFTSKGTFTEMQGINDRQKWSGKYSLVGATFTHRRSGKKNMTFGQIIEQIIWINKNKFYSSGTEGPGGPTIYTYWQRINK